MKNKLAFKKQNKNKTKKKHSKNHCQFNKENC